MAKTKIEWADRTWNPVTGCTKISPGCANCYAERMSKRLGGRCGYSVEKPFQITKHADEIFLQPIRWRKPSRIFVCSMGDLFHDEVPDTWIAAIIAVMAMTYDHTGKMRDIGGGASTAIFKQRHTYMLLTKRPERMKSFFTELSTPNSKVVKFAEYMCQQLARKLGQPFWMNAPFVLGSWLEDGMPGLWLGVTAENQEQADKRIPILLQIYADKRFVSVEPMLGPVDLTKLGLPYGGFIDHVICGGESGPGARPMHPDWVRSLRDQCHSAGVPFLFKQWGEWNPREDLPWEWDRCPGEGRYRIINFNGGYGFHGEKAIWTHKVGKKKAGRVLDGQIYDEYPQPQTGAD